MADRLYAELDFPIPVRCSKRRWPAAMPFRLTIFNNLEQLSDHRRLCREQVSGYSPGLQRCPEIRQPDIAALYGQGRSRDVPQGTEERDPDCTPS